MFFPSTTVGVSEPDSAASAWWDHVCPAMLPRTWRRQTLHSPEQQGVQCVTAPGKT